MARADGETRRPRRARIPLVLGALGTVGLAALLATAWAVLSSVVAREVVRPVRRFPDDVPIRAADRDTVTLAATPETVVPGRYGLFFSGGDGYALLGDPIRTGPGTVTRRVDRLVHGDLASARAGRWSGWYFLDPADLDVPHREVEVQTDVGAQPAWAIENEDASDDWAILVHGRGVTRAETLRAVPALRSAGWNCLAVSYRNDRGAAPSEDGRYALGHREWADVEAALGWTSERSAGRLLLVGWSMGGATALQTLDRSVFRDRIVGAALDSPVLDWRDVLREQARVRRLPRGVGTRAMRLLGSDRGGIGLSAPIDLDRLDWVGRADELDRPILIQHSRDDRTVPSGPSERLAEQRPDLITLELWDRAQHTRLWNLDPDRWARTLERWLSGLS